MLLKSTSKKKGQYKPRNMTMTHLGLFAFIDFFFNTQLQILNCSRIHNMNIYKTYTKSSLYKHAHHMFDKMPNRTKTTYKEITEGGPVHFKNGYAHSTSEFETDKGFDVRERRLFWDVGENGIIEECCES